MDNKTTNKTLIISSVMLAVYAVITFIGAINHEMWFDETQAWNIARDNDIAGIIRAMQYEGHPPLWHFILFVFSHLGFSCDVMPLISWFFSVVTVALIAYKMPFNLIVKGSVIFSGGFLFFNSVISRVYCLIPLLLCLIAILYPNRKKYAVVYGLLVGLLATTHIVMCGVVGALGIFMLIDLFREWKTSSAKQKLFDLLGLALAGAGVLLLVLPAYQSLSLNQEVGKFQNDFGDYFRRLVGAPYSVGVASTNHEKCLGELSAFTTPLLWLGYIAVMVLIRRHKRALVTELLFTVFYVIISELIWVTIPNRALIFVFSLVFVLWLAYGEDPSDKEYKNIPKASSPSMQKLFDVALKLDRTTFKTGCILIIAVNILTIPMGALYLFSDYTQQFAAARKTAEYIRENFSTDTVFVHDNDGLPDLSAYLPEYRFYSVETTELSTYAIFQIYSPDVTYEEISADLAQYENVYLVKANNNPDFESYMENIVYTCDEGMVYGSALRFIEISEYTPKNLQRMINYNNGING